MAIGISFSFSLYIFGCKFPDLVDMALFVDAKSQERVSCASAQNMDLFINFKNFCFN